MIEGCKHGPTFMVPQPCAECERERGESEAKVKPILDRLSTLRAAASDDGAARPQPAQDEEIRRWRRAEQELSSRYVKLRIKLERFGALDTKRGGEDRFERTEAALDTALSELDRLRAAALSSPSVADKPRTP